jgi:hypothetical protein
MDSTFSNLEALIKEAGLTMPSLNSEPTLSVSAPVKKKKFMLVGNHAHQMTG